GSSRFRLNPATIFEEFTPKRIGLTVLSFSRLKYFPWIVGVPPCARGWPYRSSGNRVPIKLPPRSGLEYCHRPKIFLCHYPRNLGINATRGQITGCLAPSIPTPEPGRP